LAIKAGVNTLTVADRQYWDDRAREYGQRAVGYLDSVQERYEEPRRWAAFQRLCQVGPGMRVLDLGCGTGRWSVRLSKLGCTVVAADMSPVMIQMAAAEGEDLSRQSEAAGWSGKASEPETDSHRAERGVPSGTRFPQNRVSQ